MLAVFLNNKLISCDTIVPLLKELHDIYNVKKIELLCFEYNTFITIKKNIVLMDAIHSIGSLKMLGRKDKIYNSKIFLILRVTPLFLKYFYLALKNKIVFLHFKELNSWPLKFFSLLFSNITLLVQPTSEGFRPLEKQVSEMVKTRNKKIKKAMGNTILAFDKDWNVLDKENIINKKVVFMSNPHKRLTWIKYMEKKQKTYFQEEFKKNKYKNENNLIIAFMLTWLGPSYITRTPNLFPELFDETLSILEKICKEYTVFVKPHPTSVNSETEMKKIKNIIKRHSNINVILTHLHPIVLSFRAKFFIANCYTTSFSTARLSNIPTIEYTDYRNDILNTTKNASMRPDLVSYFINRDSDKLKNKILQILHNDKERKFKIDKSILPNEMIKVFKNISKY